MNSNALLAIAFATILSAHAFGQIVQDYSPSVQNSAFNKEDNAVAVAHDVAGNTYLTGTSQYTLSGGTRNAVWTMKLDQQGLVVWEQFGRAGLTGENDFAKGIAVDSLGNVYVAAEGNHTATTSLMLLIKYRPSGAIQWRKFYNPTTGHNVPVGVGVDSSNRSYIGGTVGDGATAKFALAQFSGGGVMNWHNEEYLEFGDECTAMKVNADGRTCLAGNALIEPGTQISWVICYDSAGDFQFESPVLEPFAVYDTRAVDMALDGSVVISGRKYAADTVLFAARFDNRGHAEWERTYNPFPAGVVSNVGGRGVAIGSDGAAYVVGAGQTSQANPGFVQGVLLKWDTLGGFKYAKTFGGLSAQTRGTGVRVDSYGRVYIAWENSTAGSSYRQSGVAIFNGASGASIAANLIGNSTNLNRAAAINIDSKGRIYLAGTNKQVPNSANYLSARYVQQIVSLNQSFSMLKNTTLHKDAVQGVFAASRYNVDGSAVLLTVPLQGSLVLNADGSFDYTPLVGFTGKDTFTYRCDQRGMHGNAATVTIFVKP